MIVKRDGDAADDGMGISQLGLAVAGKVNAYLVPEGNQGAGQGPHDVGESPGF